MKVLQINAVYEKASTGRTTMELHEAMCDMGITSYVASPDIAGLKENSYQIGNLVDWKIHAIFSRIFGKQGYFSKTSTRQLLKYIDEIQPDIIHLHNLHSNYINLPMVLSYIADRDIATVITLHDCWFYTGKCVYYIEFNCERWKDKCGDCPALHTGNNSYFFDFSKKILGDRKKLFGSIERLAVIGVSKWVTGDAAQSILRDAKIVQCIYNWVDLNLFRPYDNKGVRERMNLENKFIIFGIASTWSALKGIDVFNELADLLPEDCKIVLVGNSSELKYKNKKICFLDTVTDVDYLARLYSMSDVFVNPTVQETFGKTTAEAMACGTPVIAYNGTATPELVGTDEVCGYLINKNEARYYLDKILHIKEKTKCYYSKAARVRAEELFSKEKNIQQYIEVYDKLIKAKRKSI